MTGPEPAPKVGAMPTDVDVAALQTGGQVAFTSAVAPHLRAIKAHCYRMSGSWHEAEDLLQDSLLRAWKGLATFRGDSSLRSWLYAVTTRTCLDQLEKRKVRTLPFALGPATDGQQPPGAPDLELPWLEPMPGEPEDEAAGPEARLGRKESVAFAFLTVVQRLPPRQRAVLLLRDVLGWPASECARALETSVASVNSALQRARETVAALETPVASIESDAERDLLGRYVRAWETAQVEQLVSLLVEGATLAMPPLREWYQGRDAIAHQLRTMALPPGSAGTRKFQLTRANAMHAVAVWRLDPATGVYGAEALQVLELSADGKVKAITAFLDPGLFAAFGLPLTAR